MFDFIKNIFKKEPQKEQVVEVEVKAKRKYKPRAPKTEDKVEEAVVAVIEPIVIAEAPVEQVRPRIMARQLVGAATLQPAPVVEAVVEPVVEAVAEKAPVKKKPVTKKPVATFEKSVEVSVAEPVIEVIAPVVEPVEVKVEQEVVKSVPKKPDNKPKAVQNKPPRGKKKKR
jgi:hypothetical protein